MIPAVFPAITAIVSSYIAVDETIPAFDFFQLYDREYTRDMSDFSINSKYEVHFCKTLQDGDVLLENFLSQKYKAILLHCPEEFNKSFITEDYWVVIKDLFN